MQLTYQPRTPQWLLIGFVLLGVWLRAKGLFDNSFHTDEALFASWARLIATGRDLWLQTQLVDKPPLLFYVQAVALKLMRPIEWAARLPNWFASVLLIPLVYQWVRCQWRDRLSALIAAVLLTLSPFMIQFSSTAFTDPLMVALLVAGLSVHSHRASGVLFGLSLATKYQAILLLPLLWRRVDWRYVVGVLGLVVCWMVVAGQGFSGSGDALLIGGIRPISSYELLPRWQAWQAHLFPIVRLPIQAIFLIYTALLYLFGSTESAERRGEERKGAADRYLWLMMIIYFCFHWLIATPLYDRYMLPLAVMVIVLMARATAVCWRDLPQEQRGSIPPQSEGTRGTIVFALRSCARFCGWVLLPIVFGYLLMAGVRARNGQFAVGGQISADEGASEIANYFADAPYGTVLYDHWYSWQWRFHLLETGVYTEWVPAPDTLINNLDVFYDNQRYIVLPADARAAPFQRALSNGGYQLQKRLQSDAMILYQIMQD